MALDAYMIFTGEGKVTDERGTRTVVSAITGEFQDALEREKGAFEVDDFDWGVSYETGESTSTKKKTNKGKHGKDDDDDEVATRPKSRGCSVNDIKIDKMVDTATPDLFLACCSGCKFEQAKIVFRKSAGTQAPIHYMVIYLYDVKVSSWSLDSDETAPVEKLRVSFKQVYVKYIPQTMEGTRVSSPIVLGYNLSDKKAAPNKTQN